MRTEQILCHLSMGSANDANFVQSAREEESSLDQAANLRRGMNHMNFAQFMPGQVQSREFCIICTIFIAFFGLS